MPKTGKQLFEYLPFKMKQTVNKIDEIPFKQNDLCMTNYYTDLKKILQLLNYPGRSYLTTKHDMCNAIKNI
jgi:hypothetical protein